MASSRHLVVNRDGYVVDLETGEVVDESPICYDVSCEVPPGLSRAEWERRLRAAPRRSRSRRLTKARTTVATPPASNTTSGGDGGVRVVSVKLPVELVSRIDGLVSSMGYPSRSHVIRDALEAFLGLGGEGSGSVLTGSAELARLRDLYVARGFVYAARSLIAMARAYVNIDDFDRVEDEIELIIARLNSMLNDLNKRLGLW